MVIPTGQLGLMAVCFMMATPVPALAQQAFEITAGYSRLSTRSDGFFIAPGTDVPLTSNLHATGSLALLASPGHTEGDIDLGTLLCAFPEVHLRFHVKSAHVRPYAGVGGGYGLCDSIDAGAFVSANLGAGIPVSENIEVVLEARRRHIDATFGLRHTTDFGLGLRWFVDRN